MQESATAGTNLAAMSSDATRHSEKDVPQTAIPDSAHAGFPTGGWDKALKTGDIVTCLRLARDAGHLRQADSAPSLAKLFAPTRGIRSYWRKRSVEWTEVRTTAVEALACIPDAPPRTASQSLDAVAALVEALFDPVNEVRTAAHTRLILHGEEAALCLRNRLSANKDWSLIGMRGVIDTLGTLKNLESGPTVARVLLRHLPQEPTRWSAATLLKRSVAIGMALGGLMESAMLSASGTHSPIFQMLPAILLGYFLLSASFSIMTFIFVLMPLGFIQESTQRAELFASAARALTKINDPRALPCVIDAALGSNRQRQGEARKTLMALLPLVAADAYGMLPHGSLQLLYAALGNALLSQELTLAIVRSLEWVGTGRAVAPVQRLVKRGATMEIRSEAERLLPCLLWRQQCEMQPTFLLRASGKPEVGGEQLLRPGMAAADNYPDELLRPSGGN